MQVRDHVRVIVLFRVLEHSSLESRLLSREVMNSMVPFNGKESYTARYAKGETIFSGRICVDLSYRNVTEKSIEIVTSRSEWNQEIDGIDTLNTVF